MKDAVGVGALNLDLIYQVKSLRIAGKEFAPGGEIFGGATEFSEVVRQLERQAKLMGKSGEGRPRTACMPWGTWASWSGTLGWLETTNTGSSC